ncbi:hypothetical protein RJ640_022263 [Escallonia rubra]|uniref:GTD-binding domain-containing protein n=1 Tax=Escallonia rubra TaxID=112253 RepID=A0AA88RQI2_9ASTE|nr:hypothetical protein RJ640_022263 [Escallonia rubra]
MACQSMHFWTFTGLVAAFLDLAIAYLLLCASAIAYFASRFLGLFGLSLPCPCNGQFVGSTSGYCLNRLLIEYPNENICSVQFSVKSKFPFDAILAKEQNCHVNLRLIGGRSDSVGGSAELEGEASCSMISDARKPENVVRRDSVGRNENVVLISPGVEEGRFDLKGKGLLNQKPRGVVRQRRKSGINYGKFSSVSSCDPSYWNGQGFPQSPSSISQANGSTGGISLPDDYGDDHASRWHCECEIHYVINSINSCIFNRGEELRDKDLHDVDLNQPLDEIEPKESYSTYLEELRSEVRGEVALDSNQSNDVIVLEQRLEEEHAACAALYLELEKERNAAATAADEAMAMILRLQEEKASIEMEARQYHRMVEEKTAYDAEEMNILKEILLRREREKHFLEKEVDTYRQMTYLGSEQLDGNVWNMEDTQRQEQTSSLHLTEDPTLMLHQLSESIAMKEKVRNGASESIGMQKCNVAAAGKESLQGWEEDAQLLKHWELDYQSSKMEKCSNSGNEELQEKEMVFVDNDPYSQPKEGHIVQTYLQAYKYGTSQESDYLEKTIPIMTEEQEANEYAKLFPRVATKTVENSSEMGTFIQKSGDNMDKHGVDVSQESRDPCNTIFDKEPHVHDVHVIGDASNSCNEVIGDRRGWFSLGETCSQEISDLPHEASLVQIFDSRKDFPSTSMLGTVTDTNRDSSDMTMGMRPMGSMGISLLSDLRRNSMSALDNERAKIDTEVGWLRERLRVVQEGREKLNLPAEHREREKLQLQLLEDIAGQLREIRLLTGPGKAVRQVSLPPPSSKDQAEDKANPKHWYTADEKSSKMSTEDLLELIREYPLPEDWYARLPDLQEPANYDTKFETRIYEEQRLLKGGPKSNKGWHLRYFFFGRLDKGELPFDKVWNPFCKDFENPSKPTPNNLTKHILSHIKLRGGLCIDEPLSEEQLEWAKIIPPKPIPAGLLIPLHPSAIPSVSSADTIDLNLISMFIPVLISFFIAKMASESGKSQQGGFLCVLQKAKRKQKEKQPSVEFPPAPKKTRVTPPERSPQILDQVSIEDDPIFRPRWTLRRDDLGMPDSQVSEQHLLHGILPRDKEVFQNKKHETFACSFAQAVYTMYASGSKMLSRFEMARQVAAEEAQLKREAIKEAQEATHRVEELSKQEKYYLAQIATLEKRLERVKRRAAEEVTKARDQGIRDFLDGNAGDEWLKKRTEDGLEIYELVFAKANEMFAERFPDIPLDDFVLPAVVSPSGETVMPSEAGDVAASHLSGEGPSGGASEP